MSKGETLRSAALLWEEAPPAPVRPGERFQPAPAGGNGALLIVLMIAGFALGLLGVSLLASPGAWAQPVNEAAPSSVTLELSVNNWGDAVIEAIEAGVRRFEQLNPGINVEVRRRGTWDDFVVRVISGVPPDVIAIGLSVGEHSEAGLLMPLDSFIGGDLWAKIIPEMWSNFTWRGRIWGVPALEHGPRLGMVWNENMLQESGLTVDPWEVMTWVEFFEYAQKLTRVDASGNVVRAGYDPRNGQNSRLYTIAASWGAEDYFPEMGVPRINHPAIVEMLQYTADSVFGRYPGFTGDTAWYAIAETHSVAATILGAYAPGEIASRDPDLPITVSWLPHPERKRVQQVNGWSLGIPMGAPYPELSFKLIEFLATDVETQLQIYAASGFLGGSVEFYQELAAVETNPIIQWYIQSLNVADYIDSPRPDPFLSRSDALFAAARDQVYRREGAAQTLLDDAQRMLEAEMREMGRL